MGGWQSAEKLMAAASEEETERVARLMTGNGNRTDRTCPDCGRVCTTMAGLASHRRAHHSAPAPQTESSRAAAPIKEVKQGDDGRAVTQVIHKPVANPDVIARFYAPMMVEVLANLGDDLAVQVGEGGCLEVFRTEPE